MPEDQPASFRLDARVSQWPHEEGGAATRQIEALGRSLGGEINYVAHDYFALMTLRKRAGSFEIL